MSGDLKAILDARWRLRRAVREFFEEAHYLEIETPILVDAPGCEVHLEYFATTWQGYALETKTKFLRSSPELHMKQALASGLPRIYQLAPSFRNHGELSAWHHPEFTMLEWYRTGVDARVFIGETLDLIAHCHHGLARAGYEVCEQPKSWHWLTVKDAFKQFADLDLVDCDPDLACQAEGAGVVSVRPDDDFETAFFKILLEKVEPQLTKLDGVILYDYPPSQAALARVEDGAARRFEIYWRGIELSNGFDELVEPQANVLRVDQVQAAREGLGKTPHPVDQHFLQAMATGLPSCCGNAMGFDRLLALCLGHDGIEAIIPFRNQF